MKNNDNFIKENSYYDGHYKETDLSVEETRENCQKSERVCETFTNWQEAWEYDHKLGLHDN